MNTFTGLGPQVRSLSDLLAGGYISRTDFLARCSQLTAQAVRCSRAGIWLFVNTSKGRTMHCLAMYDAVKACMTPTPDEEVGVDAYFKEFDQHGFVMADDVDHHVATAGVFAGRLNGIGVQSLLAASFSVNGHLFGTMTCTMVGSRRHWLPRELAMLRQIGGPTGLALFKAGAVPGRFEDAVHARNFPARSAQSMTERRSPAGPLDDA